MCSIACCTFATLGAGRKMIYVGIDFKKGCNHKVIFFS